MNIYVTTYQTFIKCYTIMTLYEEFKHHTFILVLIFWSDDDCVFFNLQRLVGRFGSQVSVISIIVTFVYLMVTPSNGSKKKR